MKIVFNNKEHLRTEMRKAFIKTKKENEERGVEIKTTWNFIDESIDKIDDEFFARGLKWDDVDIELKHQGNYFFVAANKKNICDLII